MLFVLTKLLQMPESLDGLHNYLTSLFECRWCLYSPKSNIHTEINDAPLLTFCNWHGYRDDIHLCAKLPDNCDRFVSESRCKLIDIYRKFMYTPVYMHIQHVVKESFFEVLDQ